MDTKHINGPWVKIFDERGILSEIIAPCHEHHACHKSIVYKLTHNLENWPNKNRDEHIKACCCEANADLIICAPEMAELVEMVLADSMVDESGNPDLPVREEWEAIVAKARSIKSKLEAQ